jgi:DNA-binding NarL/FixJ family response regulator
MDVTPRATGHAIRVLLVDDSADFRAAARAYLRSADGVELVGEAHDGREAFEQVERLLPDLVLMDVRMPHGNGIKTAARIKALARSPVVVLFTVNAEPYLLQAALAAGADDCFAKSDFVQHVEAAFDRVIRRRTVVTGPR